MFFVIFIAILALSIFMGIYIGKKSISKIVWQKNTHMKYALNRFTEEESWLKIYSQCTIIKLELLKPLLTDYLSIAHLQILKMEKNINVMTIALKSYRLSVIANMVVEQDAEPVEAPSQWHTGLVFANPVKRDEAISLLTKPLDCVGRILPRGIAIPLGQGQCLVIAHEVTNLNLS